MHNSIGKVYINACEWNDCNNIVEILPGTEMSVLRVQKMLKWEQMGG